MFNLKTLTVGAASLAIMASAAAAETVIRLQSVLPTSGDEVRIVGFGSFSVAHRAASTGRNPRTGEVIQIAASKQPQFRAGAPLKAAVNS